MADIDLIRSWLYVPGDRSELLEKAPGRGADALICDLEDAVGADSKDAARDTVAAFVAERDAGATPSIWVRVNPEHLADEIAAVTAPALAGIVVPKATSAAVAEASNALDHAGAARAGLVALIESAIGLLDAPAMARGERVRNLALGEADLSAELGVDDSASAVFAHTRGIVVVASAAAGLVGPTAPASTDFNDIDAFRAESRTLVAAGFRARSAIHPAQVPVIHEVLTPDEDEAARARSLVERFDAAAAEGRAVLVDDDGRMVDSAVVRRARDVVARADAAERARR